MHKGIILLVKSDNRDNAVSEVKKFMEMYYESAGCGEGCGDEPDCDNCTNRPEGFKHGVWDWYVIGGRWSGTLTESMLSKEKLKQVYTELKEKNLMYYGQEKEMDAVFRKYFSKEDYPYPSTYIRDQCTEGGYTDDILPLSDCLLVVRDWLDSYSEQIVESKEQVKKWEEKGDSGMIDYCKRRLERMESKQFSDDSNVYNITDDNMEIPENTEDWLAVMIDIHN